LPNSIIEKAFVGRMAGVEAYSADGRQAVVFVLEFACG
jgi:hypothetical protein